LRLRSASSQVASKLALIFSSARHTSIHSRRCLAHELLLLVVVDEPNKLAVLSVVVSPFDRPTWCRTRPAVHAAVKECAIGTVSQNQSSCLNRRQVKALGQNALVATGRRHRVHSV